ncbi:alpha/beta hydrolase [Pseudonocardia sp. ICBG1293]|uniref:alpha/beta hydrolase n=1 Tax=Pseudonocardia sp. ICBG1293 TaxID=2844382 RepID=UPI001CC9540C|nr:alpha/beta hydrolase [Pseudonocardia sp. ICBG1293]
MGQDAATTAEPPATRRPRRAAAVSASLLTAAAVVVLVWTVLAQALALAPVGWWGPLLAHTTSQGALIVLGSLRDGLGVWNVVLALLGVAAAAGARALSARRRAGSVLVAATVAAALVAAGTHTALVVTVARDGGGLHPFSPASPVPTAAPGPDRTVEFGAPGGTPLLADLYLPRPGAGPAPVLVRVHGGGFVQGSRGPSPYNRFLADAGYAVVDVDYRLATPQRQNWDTQVGDVGCALTWVGTAGPGLGLDPSRVGVLGESAGGNLAVNAGYLDRAGTLVPTCGDRAALPRVRAVAGMYPAVDLTATEPFSAIGREVGATYVGGPPERFPQRYAFTDSLTHARPDSPPTLVVQGSADHLVPADPVARFAAATAGLGVPTRYLQLPGLEHGAGDGLGTRTPGTELQRAALLSWFDRWVR